MEIKSISDWAVTDKLRAKRVSKKNLYNAIMSGDLLPELRLPGQRDWRVSETNIDAYLSKVPSPTK